MNELLKNIYVVLHNVHSASKTIETAQVVYGLGFSNFVVSKAEGSAAQAGVPDANRLAMKMKCNFMVLPGLKDVLEVLQIEQPLMVTSPVLVKERLDFVELSQQVKSGERAAIILSGSNNSFSRKEMDFGKCRSLEARVDIGPSGSAAVILYSLTSSQNV
ncbi:MAG: RecB-family nuclease [Candidatus Thorarchaeota archaeon]